MTDVIKTVPLFGAFLSQNCKEVGTISDRRYTREHYLDHTVHGTRRVLGPFMYLTEK